MQDGPIADESGGVLGPDFGAPALRPVARERPARRVVSSVVAAVAFASFFVYYGLLCFRHEGWGGDFQMYCAGASQLYRDFAHPSHEAVSAPGTQSTVYTLHLVVVAALGKLFGATPYRALEVAGLVNLLIFMAAVGYFVSRHSAHRRWELSAACFLFADLLLRWRHFGWSSETSLTSLQYIQSYPSTFAWAMAFVAFGLMQDAEKKRSAATVVALAAVLWALLLSHLITASWVIGVVVLYGAVHSLRHRDAVPIAGACAAVATAVLLALPWPYAPLYRQASLSQVHEPSPFGNSPFVDFPNLYAVAIPAAGYLVLRLRRHAFWVLAWAATLGALALWRALNISFGNRYSFFGAFFAQFMVAEAMVLGIFALVGPLHELPLPRRHRWLDRPAMIAVLAAAALAWLPSPMIEQARKVPELGSLLSPSELLALPPPDEIYYRQFSDLVNHLSHADVVLTPESRAVFDLASITGAQVVSAPNALRVPDRAERSRDVSKFFDRVATRTERVAIVRRYRVTKVMLPAGDGALLGALTELFGDPIYRDHAYDILSTTSGGSSAGGGG